MFKFNKKMFKLIGKMLNWPRNGIYSFLRNQKRKKLWLSVYWKIQIYIKNTDKLRILFELNNFNWIFEPDDFCK